ncbi:MAG TPA: hypothetical protein VGI10_25575, partial [Polyangiaceae bacterium]
MAKRHHALTRTLAFLGLCSSLLVSCGNASHSNPGGGEAVGTIAQAVVTTDVIPCGASSRGEPCTLTITHNDDNSVDYAIEQPVVNISAQDFPEVKFQPGDQIFVDAGGCVQTGGVGSTWKRYVDPSGSHSDEFYFGLITIPGATFQSRISGVQDTTVSIPQFASDTPASQGCIYPASAHLRLGYPDDEYDDNGYYNHDNGSEDQCDGVGSAFVHLHVTHGTPGPWPAGPDFDIVPACIDDNYIFLNSRWGWQVPGKVTPYNVDAIQSLVSQPTSEDHPPEGILDVLELRPFKPFACGWGIGDTGIEPVGADGHRNWMEVTYTGPVGWDEHSTVLGSTALGDDDYNITMITPDPNAGGTVGDDGNVIVSGGLSGRPENIKLEFDSDETIDEFGQDDANLNETGWWWKKFQAAVDTSKEAAAAFINNHQAIVVGLMGVDEAHKGGTGGEEVHPVHAFAVRSSPIFIGDNDGDPTLLQDHWSFFVRNWGDEGYCSSEDHYLDLTNIVLAFPPSDPTVIDPTQPGIYQRANVRSNRQDSSVSVFPVADGTRPDVLFTFTMSQPPDHAWIAGEIDVAWKRTTPLQPAPPMSAALVVTPPTPEEEADEDDSELVVK